VFFSPEIIIDSKSWRKVLLGPIYEKRLKALVVDEAHTVKKW
jgi:superfamily II DNA helicase RecQ